MMRYVVKEIYPTIQGEGFLVGSRAVFLRFSGCPVGCAWCDTDYNGTDGAHGGAYTNARDLAAVVETVWDGDIRHRLVVLTGGEPALQVDPVLVYELGRLDFTVAIETSGVYELRATVDHVCVSPKVPVHSLMVRCGQDLKLVHPWIDPAQFVDLDFSTFILQPLDDGNIPESTRACIEYVKKHPQWRVGGQMHKVWGVR